MSYKTTIEWLVAINGGDDQQFWIGNIQPQTINILFRRDLVEWLGGTQEYFMLSEFGAAILNAYLYANVV